LEREKRCRRSCSAKRDQCRKSSRSITLRKFTSKAFDEWAWRRGIKLDFTRPGKPKDNSFIASFDGRLRDECLNANEFVTIDNARVRIEAWRQDYNQQRRHGSLGYLTPSEFAKRGQETAQEATEL
jgi:putative transposase